MEAPTDEEIEIAVIVDIGQGRIGAVTDTCYPEDRLFAFSVDIFRIARRLNVSGLARRAGVTEEVGKAIPSDEEILIAVIVNITKAQIGPGIAIFIINYADPEGLVSSFLGVNGSDGSAGWRHSINHQVRIVGKGAGISWFSEGEDGWIASGIGDGAAVECESC